MAILREKTKNAQAENSETLHPGPHPGPGLVVDHVEMTSRGNGLRHRTVWSQSPGAEKPFRMGKSHGCPCEKGWKKTIHMCVFDSF